MALFNISVSCQLGHWQEKERPNISRIFAEDTSWMGCYGDPTDLENLNIDSLANKGIRFSRAFVPAPVCSACRSALMAGQNQIRINAHGTPIFPWPCTDSFTRSH